MKLFKKKYIPSYKQETRTKVLGLLTDERLLLKYRNYEKLINKLEKITVFKLKETLIVKDKKYEYKLTSQGWFTVNALKGRYHLFVMLTADDLCSMYIEEHIKTFIKLYKKVKEKEA